MYVSVCINTWYIHDIYVTINVDKKCLVLALTNITGYKISLQYTIFEYL